MDELWDDSQKLSECDPSPVLILSKPFDKGSAEEEQLTSILKAGCKLNDEQYCVVMLGEEEMVAWYKLKDKITPKTILMFGIMPAQLGISSLFKFNEVNRFDSCYWVPTLPLLQLKEDKAIKGKLWNGALKPLFETKEYGQVL